MIAHDIRYAFRTFRQHPGFTAAALLSLAIGIGATTSIFSVLNALLLRPLPYADADRLAILWNRSPGLGITEDWFSTAQYFDIKNSHQGIEEIAIAIGANFNLSGDGPPERVGTIRVSSTLLPMLGAVAVHGRLFDRRDDVAGAPRTAVLGHGTWMRRFGGRTDVIGQSIRLNGQPYEIVGVLPAWFDLPREVMPTLGGAEHAEIVIPLPLAADAATIRNREDYNLLIKLKRGVGVDAAQAEMDALTARLRRDFPNVYPSDGGLTFDIVPLQEQVVGDVRRPIAVLVGAVAFVLLIACVNVANLLLSRAIGRRKEMAVRAALGASRARVVRQLLVESLVLSLSGGLLGLLLSFASLRGIKLLGSASVPRLSEIVIDAQVLVFTVVVCVLSAVLFGLAPAWRASRFELQRNLADFGRGSAAAGSLSGRGQGVRKLLVVAEVALSVVLLVGAGLLVRSFAQFQRVHPGFDPANVLTLELTMTGPKYPDAAAVIETYRLLWERLTQVPGVTFAGAVSALPLSQMMAWGPITVEGRTPPPGESFINVDQRIVGGDYFRAMQIPIVAGRMFDARDTRETMRVVIVDERMAKEIWPGDDPLGKRIRTGGMDANPDAPWMTVVGVANRIKQDRLDADSRMAIYHPHSQFPARSMNVVVRSDRDAASVTSEVGAAIRAIDADLPMYRVRTMETRVAESLARRRFAMILLSTFAWLALALSAIGLYGVMSYLVGQSTRELGIRLALGATPARLLILVIGSAMTVCAVGIGAGIGSALLLTRLMQSLLFGIGATDAVAFLVAPLVLILVALGAATLPARRAARVDPTVSLRTE